MKTWEVPLGIDVGPNRARSKGRCPLDLRVSRRLRNRLYSETDGITDRGVKV